MSYWRLIVSQPSDAYTNMAIDEAILQMYVHKGGVPVLRIYGWTPPAVSLGFSQSPDSALNLACCRKNNIDFVRRITGGEAVYHSQEVTYSIICRKEDLDLSNSVKESFRLLTDFVFNAYRSLGVSPYFAGDLDSYQHGDPSEFCFATTEKFDIIINGKKIGGNAQKRSRDVIFQHGSIPLKINFDEIKKYINADFNAIESKVTFLEEAINRAISYREMSLLLIDSFKDSYNVELRRSALTSKERNFAHILTEEKYKTRQWNYFKRSRIKNKEKEERDL